MIASSGASTHCPSSTKLRRLTISAHDVITSRNASGTSTATGLRPRWTTQTATTASASPAVSWLVVPKSCQSTPKV